MPYSLATFDLQAEITALLAADSAFQAACADKPSARGGGEAIYDDGDSPQGQTFPYLTIGAWTQVPFHNLGSNYGWNCTVQLKAIGQRIPAVQTLMDAAISVLPEGLRFDVTNYGDAQMGEVNVQPMLKEVIAGVPVFSLPAIFRVYVQ